MSKREKMGQKLDALFGRTTFKTSKFKPLVNLAISRLAIFKNQRQSRCAHARSAVVNLLQLGQHERALLSVEHVIREQNMLDVFVLMEGYCNLVVERVHLIEQERVCPDELREAISGLLHGASRCGDFPELQEIRALFTSRYGKEFTSSAIELRNNCGVNRKMIQKLSTRQPDLESRMKVLKEIAAENNIVLQLEEEPFVSTEEKLDVNKKQNLPEPDTPTKLGENMQNSPKEREKDDGFSDSIKGRNKYRDVADAAQAAFESAAYAAAAARAAVELSRSGPYHPDDHNSPSNRQRKESDGYAPIKPESESINGEIQNEVQVEESKQSKNVEFKKSMTASSSDSSEDNLIVNIMPSDEVDPVKLLDKEIVFDESDNENETHDLGSHTKTDKLKNKIQETEKSYSVKDGDFSEKVGAELHHPSSSSAGLKAGTGPGHPTANATEGYGMQKAKLLNLVKGPFSVRTRGVRGY